MHEVSRLVGIAMCVLAALGAAGTPLRAETGAPQRIVSVNLCTDQILLDLVPKERIAGLSFLASDPSMSADPEAARGITSVRGEAEEVLALAPDLVLVGEYSTPATQSLLKRLGVRVAPVPIASSLEEIRAVVRLLAGLIGETERGEELIRAFDAKIAAARAGAPAPALTALAYQLNSLTSGPGSLIDEMLGAAGFVNAAAGLKLGPGGRLPLENLIQNPPDLFIFANAPDDFRSVLGDNLRHPALAAILEGHHTLHLPMPLWLCGTLDTARAIEELAEARRAIARGERVDASRTEAEMGTQDALMARHGDVR